MSKLDIKDNPQERQCGWFAGIIDGEGTIGLCRSTRKLDGKITLVPYVGIINTDILIIQECSKILKQNMIKHHTYLRDMGKNKPVYNIRIDGIKSVERLLVFIESFLIGKKIQSKVLLEYIAQRKEKYLLRDSKGRILRLPYDSIDLGYYEKLKELHHIVSSETIRRTSVQPEDDIVRTLQKCKEVNRND